MDKSTQQQPSVRMVREQGSDLVHALNLLKDPKLRALFFEAEHLSEHKKDLLVQKALRLLNSPNIVTTVPSNVLYLKIQG